MKKQLNKDDLQAYFKAQKFYFLAEQCLNLVKKSLSPLLKKYGLNHSQYLILMIMNYADLSGNRVISTELSYLLGLEKHSISTLVDNLFKKALLERSRSKTDRREVFLRLTPKGKKLIEKVQPQTMEMVSIFPECKDDEYNRFNSFLFSLREMVAQTNSHNLEAYKNAYEKLLLKGEEEYLKRYLKD
ncbi:MAG: winged helix DNA-binding protein [Spirochaetota bacterium]